MDGDIKSILNGPHEYVNGKYVVKEAAKPEEAQAFIESRGYSAEAAEKIVAKHGAEAILASKAKVEQE